MPVQLYRCPTHGLMEAPPASGDPRACPIYDDDLVPGSLKGLPGRVCGERLEGPMPYSVDPLWALTQAFRRASRAEREKQRRRRLHDFGERVRQELDYGRG